MSETAPEKIPSGTYRPNMDVTLVVWNAGDNPPAGFDVERTSDGSQIAVRKAFGEAARDDNGNAAALVEGGALATLPDGTYQSLEGPELEHFLHIYKPVDESAPAAPVDAQPPTNGTGTQAPVPPAPVAPAPVASVQPDADHPLSPDGSMIWNGTEWVAYTAPAGG